MTLQGTSNLLSCVGRPCLQVLIRWAVDRGCSVLPKSTNAERIAANLALVDWSLSGEDVQLLSNLPFKVRDWPGLSRTVETISAAMQIV